MILEKISKARKNWCSVLNDCSGGHIFNFDSKIFVCGGQLLSFYFASLIYFFHFPLYVFIHVNSHCPRASGALEKPSIDTEVVQEDGSINSWTVGLQVSNIGFVLLLNYWDHLMINTIWWSSIQFSVILPKHDSSFCFIVEEPGFGWCFCLTLFLLCFAIKS